MASEAAAAEELSFVGEASIAAKSPVAEDALVEEEPLGADATGAAATAAKAVAPKDVEPQGIEFNQKESTICAFDACDIHSLAATVAIQRTVPLVAGVVGAADVADGIAADVVAGIADAANASDAAFTIDTEHEKSLVADKNSTRSVELKLENDKPIPNIPNLDSDTDHNCCIRTNFQSKTVQLTQINGVKSPSRSSHFVLGMKKLDTTSTIPTKTIAKSGREQLDVDKALCPCGATTKLEYLFNGVNKRNASNADVDFIVEAKVVEKVSNVVCLIFYLLYQQIYIFPDLLTTFFFTVLFLPFGFYIY